MTKSTIGLAAAAIISAVAVMMPKGQAEDWPQWRGTGRDGLAASSPKLMDAWPSSGPKLLWKSDAIPGVPQEGGTSSPVVSGGKVFVYVHWRRQTGKISITTQMLKEYGWEEGVPDDLAKKIEEARLNDKRKSLSGAALESYITEFMAGVDAETVKKFGEHIKLRLTQGREALSWEKDFAHLVKARDKEFKTFEELFQAIDHVVRPGTHGNPGSDKIVNLFLKPFMAKVFSFTDTVLCLDEGTGKEVWRKEFPGDLPEMELYWGASATPSIWKDRIYVAGSAGLYCLSVKDGSEVWKVKADLGMSSPLVVNGRVFVYEGDRSQDAYKWHSAKSLTAFNAENGQVLWRQPKVGNCNGSVVQWVSGGKNYLISGAPGGPWCVDPDTGDVVWSHPAGSPGVAGIWTCDGTPVVSGDIVVLYAEPKMAFKMTPQKAEFLWKVPNGSRGASPLIYNDYAYFLGSQGQVLCVELKTGAVKWNKGGVTGEVSSPILADGKIFYDGGNPASVGMFKASQEKFEELSRFQSQTTGAASPAIVDGKLYVRSKEGVACYDLREHGPYLGDVSAEKSGIVFSIKQAEGGLAVKDSPDGTIMGVTITGADGKATAAKARARGSDIVVDIQGVSAPMEIRSAWSNSVTTKAGVAVPDLHWKSQALNCRQISGSVVTLAFNKTADADVWKTEQAYGVAGMKVSNVELASDRLTVRLNMDRALKIGEVLSIKYPWIGAGATDVPPAELKFTALPGRPVEGGLLQEFLLGETAGDKKGATAAALLDGDALDKDAKPAAGGKWKLVESVVRSRSGELGTVNLGEYISQYDSLTHACVYVYSDASRKIQFSLGSCTAIRIFVNGKAVHTNLNATAPDPFAPDVDKVKDVELAKGWNTVLLSIVGSGGWRGFSLRIRDENGNAPSGLSYTAEKPAEN